MLLYWWRIRKAPEKLVRLFNHAVYLKLSLFVSLEQGLNLWYHYDCVYWYDRYPDTGLLRHVFDGVDRLSWRLAWSTSGNPLLYPVSVSDCPKPEQGVFIVQIFFPQNNIFIFNLFSACLHPHTPTTHTTKPHPQEP